MVMTSRFALEGLLQNRLGGTDACKNTVLRMRESASDLFRLYAGEHHQADDTSSSSSSGGADTMTADATIKRESNSPTTDQSEDSGVDVSAATEGNVEDGRGRSYCAKRKRSDDDDSDGGGDRPSAAKSSRTTTGAATVQLSVNVAASPPPFRPWSSSDESSSDVGLRLFNDIRRVDRIRTLTEQRRTGYEVVPPSEPSQPLDLTKGHRGRREAAVSVHGQAEKRADADRVNASPPPPPPPPPPPSPPPPSQPQLQAAAGTTTRYSKNMSRARRIEANARERSRVHTISAAFDTLRSSIPSYSRNQKLSKLSTIRIASAYILTLSRLLDMDYSAAQDAPTVDECVDNVTGIIHLEGKARKRRDEQQRHQ